MPTIKDVASEAGVSIATVSAVINGTRPVSDATRRRVEAVIQRLGYQPNRMAQGLKQGKSRIIAYILPSVTNPFFPSMLKGVEDIAYEADYSVLVCNTEMEPRRINRYSQLIREMQIDGVIITSPGLGVIHELVGCLNQRGITSIVLHGPRSIESVDRVLVDDEECGYLASSYLAQEGHGKIGFIGVCGSTTSWLRYQGFVRGLHSFGLKASEEYVCLGEGFSQQEGHRLGRILLDNQASPTGIVAANDLMAIGLWEAVLEAGLHVPEDVSLIGIDNTLAALLRPRMASVRIPTYEMGRAAAKQLLARIDGSAKGPPMTICLQPELVSGSTITALR
jgi:LacI family transcriptional regulator